MIRVREIAVLICAPISLAITSETAASAEPALRLEPYAFRLNDGSTLMAERGRYWVPEDRNDPASRKIEIGFLRFRSTNPNPGPPIIYLSGGPGGSGVERARAARQPVFMALRQAGDVIALDQRGTGWSNHIPACTAPIGFDKSLIISEASLTAYFAETLRRCLAFWRSSNIALGGYDTEQIADDVEDLRRLLGTPKVHLWGISYGTHLGLTIMRRHPQAVARAAFASAEGLSQTVKLPLRIDAVYPNIERSAGLRPGELTSLMRKVHDELDRNPRTFTVRLTEGGTDTFRADSFAIRRVATMIARDPEGIRHLVEGYRALDRGENGALIPFLYNLFLSEPLVMRGMPELIDLSSGIDAGRLRQVQNEAVDSLAGASTNFPMPQIAFVAPEFDLGDAFREEISSSIPTLLLSGNLDTRTSLEEQEEAVSGLSSLHQIIVRNGGHNLFEAHPDVPGILVDFFLGRQMGVRYLDLPPPRLDG